MINIININWYGRQTVRKEWISTDCITNKLYYIHGGVCHYIDNDEKIELEKNCLYLIPASTSFQPYSDENDPLDHSFVDFNFIPPILSKGIYKMDPNANQLMKAASDFFVQLVGNKKNTTYYHNDFNKDVLEVLNPTIKIIVKQFVSIYNLPLSEDKLAICIIRDLIENVGNNITINDLAKKYYTSPDVIIRTFKKSYNTTPYAYLKELRLKTAKHLIQSGEKLSNVAKATNYSDTSSLAHALKKDLKKNTNN